MKRRTFLQSLSAAAACAAARGTAAAAAPLIANDGERSFLLSSGGCGRATGYAETNKIVTRDEKTHVAWLDSPAEGFRVRVRTFDRRTETWSPVVTVGEGHDNHGGPALTIDSQGYLHVVYFPHHHPFRYRRSTRPNDASEWEPEISFGQRCTYPTLVCGADDTLYLTCRQSFRDQPWQAELWVKRPNADWRGPAPVLSARFPGYAHFQESLAWGPDHRTLHLCGRVHEKSDRQAYGRLQTVGYLVSRDLGRTWKRADGSSVNPPSTAETMDVIARGGVDQQRMLRAGALAVDASGMPHVVYSLQENGRGQTFLARPQPDGTWSRVALNDFLPERWKSWDLIAPAGCTFNSRGELMVVAQMQQVADGANSWGHATNEPVLFRSGDAGRSFQFELLTRPDPHVSHWLPNMERATGHNRVPENPGILYTAGPPGEKNTDLLGNRVYFWS